MRPQFPPEPLLAPDDPRWTMLDRYAAGECTKAEAETVRAWLDEEQAAQSSLAHVEAVRHVSTTRLNAWDIDRLWSQTKEDATITPVAPSNTSHHLGASDLLVRQSTHPSALARRRFTPFTAATRQPLGRPSLIGVAAVTLVMIGSIGYYVRSQHYGRGLGMSQVYTTANGQRRQIQLSDGTAVMLDVASQLRVPPAFGRARRDITLHGRALFTVSRASGLPFVVHTGGTTTRVLGTTFAVRHYADDRAAQIVVAQGRVMVGDSVLATGDQAVVRAGTTPAVTHGVDVATQFAWADNTLVFHETPLRDVVAELRRWYGIEMTVTNPALLDATVTATFRDEASLDVVALIGKLVKASPQWMGPTHVTLVSARSTPPGSSP